MFVSCYSYTRGLALCQVDSTGKRAYVVWRRVDEKGPSHSRLFHSATPTCSVGDAFKEILAAYSYFFSYLGEDASILLRSP